jgi:5-(carboxyamino)imidazole ribonucleotide mutase
MAIGRAGAVNAALMAAAIVANADESVAAALDAYRKNQTDKVLADADPRQ